MVRRRSHLLAAALVLLGGETAGFAPSSHCKRSPIGPPTTGVSSKKGVGGNGPDWQSSTILTSTYVEARHASPRSLAWVPPLLREAFSFKQWTAKLSKRKRVKQALAVILGALIVFGPSFSPANAATTAVAAAPGAASVGRGISPVMPFSSQSRALGSFSLLPTKAELELCFRLLYSVCSGAFIGLERSSSDRPAGVRTMALVGLGACIYSICSTHGFLPHTALGCAPGSPLMSSVKVDLSRMAANVATGVGFIGAGAVHKAKLHGNGTEAQNVVSGLTTAAAIWVSAAVGIASAVGLYFVGAVSTFATVAVLKYARLPKEEEPGFSWAPRPLDVVDNQDTSRDNSSQARPSPTRQDPISGLFGKRDVSGYDPHTNAFVDEDILERYSKDSHPIIVKEVIDPRFEQYLRSRFNKEMNEKDGVLDHQDLEKSKKVLIEEEQEVISYNVTDGDASVEP